MVSVFPIVRKLTRAVAVRVGADLSLAQAQPCIGKHFAQAWQGVFQGLPCGWVGGDEGRIGLVAGQAERHFYAPQVRWVEDEFSALLLAADHPDQLIADFVIPSAAADGCFNLDRVIGICRRVEASVIAKAGG